MMKSNVDFSHCLQDVDVKLRKLFSSIECESTCRSLFLKAGLINTPIGCLVAVADDQCLCLLECFDDQKTLLNIEKLSRICCCAVIMADSLPITSIRNELSDYFKGSLRKFRTPVRFTGSPFQICAWTELTNIPYGETRSYVEQARAIGKETAYRAVANANGANKFIIIVPCHRVIRENGNLGGFSSGIERKIWLQNHERKYNL